MMHRRPPSRFRRTARLSCLWGASSGEPVSALAGVSDGDAAALKQAFNVKTVGYLGRNKYFRTAQALTLLAESAGKKEIAGSVDQLRPALVRSERYLWSCR